jgi:hypothetical protein
MTETSQADTGKAVTTPDRSLPHRITGRLLTALNAMVWEGLTRKEAAKAAGFAEHSLYVALRKPHVRQWYLGECEVLRLSGRAKRLHRLEELAMQDENKNAAVAAIKAADQLEDQAAAGRGLVPMTPGFVVVIAVPRAPEPQAVPAASPSFTIEATANPVR